jgi:hypothetical protein
MEEAIEESPYCPAHLQIIRFRLLILTVFSASQNDLGDGAQLHERSAFINFPDL